MRLVALVVLALGLVLLPAASANTPNPTSVTIAGSLQSEAGCGGDWDPACATTHLAYDANDDVWQGSFSLPAGSYDYKAALNIWQEMGKLPPEYRDKTYKLRLARLTEQAK